MGILDVPAEVWFDHPPFGLCLPQGDAGLKAAHHGDNVYPIPLIVENQGGEEVGFGARRKDGAEIEGCGQHSYDGNGGSVQINGLAHNRGVAGKLAMPVCIAQQRHRLRPFPPVLRGEQATELRLDAQNLKEVADHFDPRGRFRVATARKTQVVRTGERFVSSDVPVGTALGTELVVRIGRVSRAGHATLLRWWSDPRQLV